MRWLSRAISIAVILVVLGAAYVLLRSRMPATQIGQSFRAWALFHDASRLAVGSPVRIAGVRVGEVDRLTVVGDFARVDMRLLDNTDIPVDSWVTKRAESAFGDSYIEIIPTSAEEGAPTARRLRSGEQIVHVQEGASTDTVLRAIARAMPRVDNGLQRIHDFALDARKWASGGLKERIVDADHWLAAGNLDQPIEAVDRGMARFESGTTRAADAVASAKPQIVSFLDRLDRGVSSARSRMRDLDTSIADGLKSARDGMDRIDPTVQQMTDVVVAINEGSGEDWKGTFGRLVNSPKLADDIEDVTESISDAVAGLNKFKSWLGLRAEWDWFSKSPGFYVTAEIRARNDKFYLIELEKGPIGGVPADQLYDVEHATSLVRVQTIHDSLRYTFQFGKTMWGHLQLRAGLKESTPGLGVDLLLNHGRLRFESDLYGSFTHTPRLKLTAQVAVYRSIFLMAGVDDLLDSPGYLPIVLGNTDVPTQFNYLRYGRDYFFGATLHFDEADLATLIRTYGALIVGLLK
ncbi:MAG TPA: MlaD family protein [Kofleriaceae bacterium]|nr:MlaD family protein [Kofleriaceae bacterium]